jgi:hypothetical protein
MEAQTRLLRVLQQGEYTTVGGRTAIPRPGASLPQRTRTCAFSFSRDYFARICSSD